MEEIMDLHEWAKQIEEAKGPAKVTVIVPNKGDPSRLKTKEEAEIIGKISDSAKKMGSTGGVQTTTKKGEMRVTVSFNDPAKAKKFAQSTKNYVTRVSENLEEGKDVSVTVVVPGPWNPDKYKKNPKARSNKKELDAVMSVAQLAKKFNMVGGVDTQTSKQEKKITATFSSPEDAKKFMEAVKKQMKYSVSMK
jgi:hypothetical protein